jgi:hypothetical protein
MLKTGMKSPIVLATTRHAMGANTLSARPHAFMMSDTRQDLETITIGWETTLTVTGRMAVVSAALIFQLAH